MIEAEGNVYLVKYIDHRPEVVRHLDEALANSIQRQLYAEAERRVRDSVEAEWGRDISVEFHTEAAQQLIFQNSDTQISDADQPQPVTFQ